NCSQCAQSNKARSVCHAPKVLYAKKTTALNLCESGYDKVPKHASIACRQLSDFVGKETRKKEKERKNNKKSKN
ncbi:MAG: hypothetical protein VX313_01635, partial [Bacteroidota bacterium]|nr:hypothetical protein [Bacteroidota bacterium]